ncbi:MAG: polysaccharide biosynthesis tyrosine autokinase [Nitrospirae bacterium]|nr:polysaccharide biosynthesis tyrosine autokinase [Nitrospirota bacterium]
MAANVGAVTLRDYLKVLFRHKLIFVIIPIAIMIPVYIGLQFQTPMYQATVKMYVKAQKETESQYYRFIASSQKSLTDEHSELVKSRIVLLRVVEALKLYETPLDYERYFASPLKAAFIDYRFKNMKQKFQELKPEQQKDILFNAAFGRLLGSVSVQPVKETNFFAVSVKDFTPEKAALIANSLSRSYVIFDLEQQILELKLQYGEKHTVIQQLETYIDEWKKTLNGERLPEIEAIGPASVKIMEQADPGEEISAAPKGLMLVFAFFSSIFLSIIFAYLFEFSESTFNSPHDLEKFLNIPFLGSVPSIPKKERQNGLLISNTNSKNPKYIQSFQNLSRQLDIVMKEKNLKSLILTDAEGSKETTTFVTNLAAYLANMQGRRVLIIKANLRDHSIAQVSNISDSTGLCDLLEGRISFEEALHELVPSLYILPSGNTTLNPITLLESPNMRAVIQKAKETFEIVFVECADLKNFTDAAILSSFVDGVIIVVNEGKVRRHVVQSAITPLEEKKSNIVGVILNNRKFPIPEILYKWI